MSLLTILLTVIVVLCLLRPLLWALSWLTHEWWPLGVALLFTLTIWGLTHL